MTNFSFLNKFNRYEEIFRQYNMPHKPVRVFTYLIGREISDLKAANWMACANRGKLKFEIFEIVGFYTITGFQA